jgi:DNA-binding NarL/FixJ family response regulator
LGGVLINKIRLLIVDDHTMFRQTLHNYLAAIEYFEVLDEAEDGIDAIAKASKLKPDVVLMDFAMPKLNGIHATREIKRRNPDVKILVLTMYEHGPHVREIFRAGASGYVVKSSPTQDLVTAIKAIYDGEVFLCPSVAKEMVDGYICQIEDREKSNYEKLTEREIELLSLIADGKKNKEISELLNISVHTVQSHRLNLMKKLDIHSSSQLVRYAIRKGLITP